MSIQISISSWTLHGLISGGLPLLDLPAQIAAHGIHTLELCHFHLPSTESGYLAELHGALRDADVHLYSVLIDTGDITSPDSPRRDADMQTIRRFIDVAATLGAEKVRVDAGLQPPTPEVIARSADGLTELARFADDRGVGTITENWHESSLRPGPLLEILDRCEGKVGLCADTGNAEGPDKYETLSLLFPRATSMHFKARYAAGTGEIDGDDLKTIVCAARVSHFAGPVSLIHGGTENEWACVETLKAALSAPTASLPLFS